MKRNIIFINSHPIQYFAPLYKAMEADGSFNLEVWYSSKHGLEGEIDRQFGTAVKWDIPLLEGYNYRFLKNNSWKPGIYSGFWGLLNLEVIKLLWKAPKSLVIVHGWNSATNILSIVAAKLFGHKTGLRGEAPITLEMERSPANIKIRRVIFGVLFPWINYFLFVGKNNRAFYEFYGIQPERLVFTPYSVDNKRFSEAFELLNPLREALRLEKGLNPDVYYVLYSGKYIYKKRPMDLLKAVQLLQAEGKNVGAVFMGDGELRQEMEDYIANHQLQHILLTGFVNQSAIPVYYTISDAFVMCSDAAETWGLSTNEAMNFGLPVIISDKVGCGKDLVNVESNGSLFNCGNIRELSSKIEEMMVNAKTTSSRLEKNRSFISKYSYQEICKNLKSFENE